MHDFACVSLSDLLTPWEAIVRRLDCALAGDFVLVLYNPRSKRRTRQLEEALSLASSHRPGGTPVGIVKNARRPGQSCAIVPLGEVEPEHVDMLSLLIIGNTSSRIVPGKGENPLDWACGARMLTPRGYHDKYREAFP
jgi:precorrin-3B C17-methyltransferase